MESTSANALAQELLDHCLAARPWPEHLLDPLIAEPGNSALFRIVVERLGDLFEPRLCRVYADLFADVIARRIPELHSEHLVARYERIRLPRLHLPNRDRKEAVSGIDREPATVFVLSRVTLGADVAITSVLLDAAKQRFPNSQICFVGPHKSWELFAADARLRHLPVAYGRSGTLDDRLSIWPQLRQAVCQPNSIVIDPDSRLTQLGLLPICPEEDYYFFESRAYGADSDESLSALARRWAAETLGIADAQPYIEVGQRHALPSHISAYATTVSLGVGENPDKRIADPFEQDLLEQLPRPILIDKGAGGEEATRVERAVSRAGAGITMWEGSFAGFAAHIQKSKLYVGYDSAGGHVAAACGVPLLSIFAGFASARMFHRWRPSGPGPIEVIRADVKQVDNLLADCQSALKKLSMLG
ncbi:MAG TPA: glycosyltransferase family 9 protein [Bryobacteraceae bacterium]|nr:glycosyltransferase family 9 protein [Bryobacteraceae bacterium]